MNPEFRHDFQPKTGILLLNLGSPDAPTPAAVRRYLREFLSDKRIIELPRLLWLPLLHGVILNLRPRQSARKYASIWHEEGAPLRVHTQAQTELLAQALSQTTTAPLLVDYAMRYGKPSIASVLAHFSTCQVERLLLVPLYPQYSAASTASALDGVFNALKTQRNLPEIRIIKHFHDDPGYIAALASRIRHEWAQHGAPDVLLMSFHGMPRVTLTRGDPYFCECQKTGRLLAEALALKPEQYRITFQSRFGRQEWLKPYTAEVLAELGRAGTRRVDAVCPGFVADCLETLEEIALEGQAIFKQHGGGAFHYLPCLNDSHEWIGALSQLVQRQLAGWLPAQTADAASRTQRAQQLGAVR